MLCICLLYICVCVCVCVFDLFSPEMLSVVCVHNMQNNAENAKMPY